MFSVITNIYNKKTKLPTVTALFKGLGHLCLGYANDYKRLNSG
jgi:hypothetical protein